MPELFAKSQLLGTFRGFAERGYEFTAEITTPYNQSFIERPQLGQFLLIELADEREASLGRITKFFPTGMLATAEGDEYMNSMQSRDQAVPEELKKDKLKYKVEIKLLGAVRLSDNGQGGQKVQFVPSQRRLPHLGAKVARPSDSVMETLCALSQGQTELGHYALGEFIFRPESEGVGDHETFRNILPELKVMFDIQNLVAKRTVVFARAGYGKSNLMKLLLSELYKEDGKYAQKKADATGKSRPVGTLLFDTDGEYFWPDFNGRPGFCDVPHLQDQLVVFTNRNHDNAFYQAFKMGGVKLDIRKLRAADVVGTALSSDRQQQQNVIKLKSLRQEDWSKLIDLVYEKRLAADEDEVAKLLGYNSAGQASAEIAAAKSNAFALINRLHDPNSILLDYVIDALQEGRIVIVDISLLSSSAGYEVAALLMRKIFQFNQEHFTGGVAPLAVNVVLEEAQSVLGKHLEESSPFVEWVKEGRKYDLGSILITQQPGSMAPEILSQSDNWFSFHLLSEGDADTLGRYNSHFSKDVLAHIVGEPIPGNCYMWSAPKQPFVLPVRVKSFEKLYAQYVGKQSAEGHSSSVEQLKARKNEKHQQWADDLFQLMRSTPIKWQEFDGRNRTGIVSGQLYYFIKDILAAHQEDAQNIEELKSVLLSFVFGETPLVITGEHNGTEKPFYTVSSSKWAEKFSYSIDELDEMPF